MVPAIHSVGINEYTIIHRYMKASIKYGIITALLLGGGCLSASAREPKGKVTFVKAKEVFIDDPFWSSKLELWKKVTIPDVLDKFEGKHIHDSGNHNVFCNFDEVAQGHSGTRNHIALPWFDGLIYESIRGIADYLVLYPDKDLETRIDRYIDRIASAQAADPDGYIDTYTTLDEPQHRWGENGGFLRWQHDVYNAGMLIEAGVHYYQATGKAKLLSVATRLANYMSRYMGPSPKKNTVPSHSGPEEALIKLYWLYKQHPEVKSEVEVPVNENDYWQLVTFWIENRGHHCGYPLWKSWGNPKAEQWIKENKYADPQYGTHSRPSWGDYAQDSLPVFEQQTIEGHAVRATLLATGIATAALENHSPSYIETAKRLWDNMVGKRMFITGGVGAIHEDEKFGPDYYLPPNAYLETCAAIGAGFFSQRMNELTGEGKYMDELERVLYNSALTAVSLSGNQYTYQNPLNADRHNRWEWHDCPCCPPMFLKFTGAFPGFIYSYDEKGIYVNLFVSSETNITLGKGKEIRIKQETEYPWEESISLTVNPQKPTRFPLRIRIPGWAQGIENPYGLYESSVKDPIRLLVNGKVVSLQIKDGYAEINRKWQPKDRVTLKLPNFRIISPNRQIKELNRQVALAIGPVIYAVESCDNPNMEEMKLLPKTQYSFGKQHGQFRDVNIIQIYNEEWQGMAIPYYMVANRDKNSSHRVWLPKK